MFDEINGIPLHPLVVHAVVVLVPLAIVGTIAIAARPAWRRTYGPLVVLVALAGAAAIPVATSSGEALERRVGNPGEHAELGDQLLWFVLPMVLLVAALVWLDRRRDGSSGSDRAGSSSTAVTVVAALAVVASLAAGFQVYRVGDSGAKAVWGSTPAAQGGDGD